VINEKHFLANYGKATTRNAEGGLIEESSVRLQKNEEISIAKKFFRNGLTSTTPNYWQSTREKTRVLNLDMTVL
jgi:hypothetical protein